MAEKCKCGCSCPAINNDVVEAAKAKMHSENTLFEVAEFFKVFGDSTRVQIINALLIEKMCVSDIANLLSMSHSSISHQLRFLCANKITSVERRGNERYYSLNDQHIKLIFEMGVEHICE